MNSIDLVLSRLENVRHSGGGWTARCPAHEDHHNSLAVHVGEDGRVLLHCFAGCTCEEIVAARGLEMRDLFSEDGRHPPGNGRSNGRSRLTIADLARDKRLSEAFLRELGVVEEGNALRIAYRLAEGTPAPRQRIRSALSAKEGSFWTKGAGDIVPYGLWRLDEARSKSYLVLVEGESDCWTLWHYGIPALGMPGADMTGKLEASHLEGICTLYVVKEPDKGGEVFIAGMRNRLGSLAWQGRALTLTLPDGIKDPNALHQVDPQHFHERFEAAMKMAEEFYLPAPTPEEITAAMEEMRRQLRQIDAKITAAAVPPPSWMEALEGALSGDDPIAALEARVVPSLIPLDGAQLDGAVKSITDAYRSHGVQQKTIRKLTRDARKEADRVKDSLQRQRQETREALQDWEAGHPRRSARDNGAAEKPEVPTAVAWPYCVLHGKIHHIKTTPEGGVPSPLCNFNARITGEELRDDGAEQSLMFVIEGWLSDGKKLARAEVPAASYPGMGWVAGAWGTRPCIFAGQGAKDHVRCAIQLLSSDVSRRTVYGHLGWRKIEGQWLYLYRGGAISAEGAVNEVAVEPGDSKLREYHLPEPPDAEELREAIRASLSLLELAPPMITYSLLSAVWRAPLSEAAFVDFSLFLSGPTGCQKTELTALAQAHYGAGFHGKNLPGNWSATANTLEKQAFLAKDAIFTVDDFAPGGITSDVQRLHREADRVLRAQGNRAGRGRMKPDGTLRPEYSPRGLIISSGEDIPSGQSLRSRLWILELSPGRVDLRDLTRAQEDAARGLLARALAGYLKWLAPQMDQLKEILPPRHRELRTEARSVGVVHDRTPDIMASLAVGWEVFLRFAREAGAIAVKEAGELRRSGWQALSEAARAQREHLKSEEPTGRFLALLSAALSSGQVHLADANTGKEPEEPGRWGWRSKGILDDWQPLGDRIGWVEGDHLLLEPEAAFAAVQKLARDQGTHLAINSRTLWRRMAEKGLLVSREPSRSRNLIRWTIAGERKSVLHLSIWVLSGITGPNGPNGLNGPDPGNHAAFGAEKVVRFSEMPEKTDQKNGPEIQAASLWSENVVRKFTGPEKTDQKNDPETQAGSDPGPIGPFGPQISDKTPTDPSDLFELIAVLREEGVTLSVQDGELWIAGKLKPGMAAVIERHRFALIALLEGKDPC